MENFWNGSDGWYAFRYISYYDYVRNPMNDKKCL